MDDVVAKLEITMTREGQVKVEGAIDNKVLAYGLLESAKDAIGEHHRAQSRLVQPVHMQLVPGRN